jgi:hypothetical protein
MQKHKETSEIKSYLLRNCIGIDKAISMDNLAYYWNTNTRQIRLIIEELREQVPLEGGYSLVALNEGYWLTKDAEEIKKFLKRYLGGAAKKFKTAQATIKQLSRDEQAKIQAQFQFETE